MSIIRKQLLSSGAALVLATSLGTIANAQSSSDTKVKRFDEIVVTARKREENIQETPLSISAFTSGMIEKAGIRDMADIAKSTPGFSLDEDFGRTSSDRPIIRGQATILALGNTGSGVSTFVDGVLLNGSVLDYDLTDVERVEVIKGPQSALYGRNTYSGAINIITKAPSDEVSADIKAEYGSFDRREISATLRGPVSDTVSATVHGRFYERGGPFTNTFDGRDVGQQKSIALSTSLYYEPSDRLNVKARVRLSDLHDDQLRFFQTDPSENNIFQDDGFLYNGNSRYFQGEIVNHPISYDDVRQFGQQGFDDVRSMQTSLTINYELTDQLDLEFINGLNTSRSEFLYDFDHSGDSLQAFGVYIDFGADPNFALFGPFFFDAHVISANDFTARGKGTSFDHSHELRLNYDGGEQWQGIVGGYYYKDLGKSEGLGQAPNNLSQFGITESFNAVKDRIIAECASRITDPIAPCFSSPHFTSLIPFGANSASQLEIYGDQSLGRSERENIALFGSVEYSVIDNLAVSAEARYKSEKITRQRTDRGIFYDITGQTTRQTTSPMVERNATYSSFNPRFTAKYKVSDNTNIYAVAARGDKPGGFNSTSLASIGLDVFDEETVWAFEGGVKNTLLDGTLIFNLAGFHNSVTNYQLTQSIALPNGAGTTTVISNVGKARINGVEAEMVYRVPGLPGLILNANYAYTDAQITSGTEVNEGRFQDVLDDGLVNCSIGFEEPDPDDNPLTPPSCNAGENVKHGSIVGRQIPRVPEHMFNLGVNYSRSVAENLDLNLNANISHESKKFVQVHNLAFVGSHTLVSGSIGLENDAGTSITLWGRNLTNEDAVVSASRFADSNQSFQRTFFGTPRLPRQYGVTLRQHF